MEPEVDDEAQGMIASSRSVPADRIPPQFHLAAIESDLHPLA
jgi:hypothetical protein